MQGGACCSDFWRSTFFIGSFSTFSSNDVFKFYNFYYWRWPYRTCLKWAYRKSSRTPDAGQSARSEPKHAIICTHCGAAFLRYYVLIRIKHSLCEQFTVLFFISRITFKIKTKTRAYKTVISLLGFCTELNLKMDFFLALNICNTLQ